VRRQDGEARSAVLQVSSLPLRIFDESRCRYPLGGPRSVTKVWC